MLKILRYKTQYIISFLFVAAFYSNYALASLSGFWAVDCKSGKSMIVIEKSPSSDLYQFIGCAALKCIRLPGKAKPTPIVEDADFSEIKEKSLLFRGKLMHKCIDIEEVTYEKFDSSQTQVNILGKWKQISITRMGKTVFQPAGSNLEYHKNGKYVVNGKELEYSINGNTINIGNGNGKENKEIIILSLTNSELIITVPNKPSSGAIKFRRVD